MIPVSGDRPESDPDYSHQYDVLVALDVHQDEIREECWYEEIRTHADGTVELLANGQVVSLARLSSRHADATLVLYDPPAAQPGKTNPPR